MATRHAQAGASTTQQISPTISIYTDEDNPSPLGSVTYQQSDTVIEIKNRVEAQLGHPIASQRLVLRSRVPHTPFQELGDERRLSDTDGTPSIRVDPANVTNSSAEGKSNEGENTPQLTNGNNSIGNLVAEQTSQTRVGQYHSHTAVSRGSRHIPGAKNSIQEASVKGKATVTVGDKYGGADPDQRWGFCNML